MSNKSGCATGLLALLLTLVLPPRLPAQAPGHAPNTLHELNSLEQFRQAFNRDQGVPRIVLLLSPT